MRHKKSEGLCNAPACEDAHANIIHSPQERLSSPLPQQKGNRLLRLRLISIRCRRPVKPALPLNSGGFGSGYFPFGTARQGSAQTIRALPQYRWEKVPILNSTGIAPGSAEICRGQERENDLSLPSALSRRNTRANRVSPSACPRSFYATAKASSTSSGVRRRLGTQLKAGSAKGKNASRCSRPIPVL